MVIALASNANPQATLTRALFVFAFAVLATLASSLAHAAKPEVFSHKGFAIRGYDPVAYFTDAKPVKGERAHQLDWNGTTWLFASAENKAKSMATPEAFAPQYGGYCAFAVAKGYTASIDPDAWHVTDGKLYLNYSKGVQRKWMKDVPGNIAKGDKNWPKVLN